MTNEQLQTNFKSLVLSHGLQQFQDALVSQAKPAVALVPGEKSVAALRPGQSKLGGRPDAPENFSWPTKDAKALSFIAQVNLAEMPKVPDSQLPSRGMLSFFYNNEVWGFDPKDRGSFQVFFFDNDDLKPQTPPPAKIEKRFFGMFSKSVAVLEYPSCSLSPELILTLPYEPAGIELSDERSNNYCNLLDAIGGHHRLLGHSEQVQNEMELECELVTNGLYCGDASGFKDPKAEELAKTAHQWKLLLQINSENNAEMMWGDLGMLYFWIKDEDLAARRFSNCWMISQCH